MIVKVTEKHIKSGVPGGAVCFGSGVGCMIQEAIRDATGWPHVVVGLCVAWFIDKEQANVLEKSNGTLFYTCDSCCDKYRVSLPLDLYILIKIHDSYPPNRRKIEPFEFELNCEHILEQFKQDYPDQFLTTKELENRTCHI